jgi:hypothetical protein
MQELGVGDYFFDSVFSDIDSLTLYAGIHPVVLDFHRMLTRRFPYAVYYEIFGGHSVVVWRVLDLRRDPKSIREDLTLIERLSRTTCN